LESSGSTSANDWISCVKHVNGAVFAANYSGGLEKFVGRSKEADWELFGSAVKWIDFSEESRLWAGAGKKGEVKVLDAEMRPVARGSFEHLERVGWSADGESLAVGAYSGKLAVGKLGEARAGLATGLKKQQLDLREVSLTELSVAHSDLVSGLQWLGIDNLLTTSFDHTMVLTDLAKNAIVTSVVSARVTNR
jgi:WD40 repeat protein